MLNLPSYVIQGNVREHCPEKLKRRKSGMLEIILLFYMRFISLSVSGIAISLLLSIAGIVICGIGGVWGFALIIFLLNLRYYWFPRIRGDNLFDSKNKNRDLSYYKDCVKVFCERPYKIRQLSFSPNRIIRLGQINAILLGSVSIIFGFYATFVLQARHVLILEEILGIWGLIGLFLQEMALYSERKMKKIRNDFTKWKPFSYIPMIQERGIHYVGYWQTFEDFHIKLENRFSRTNFLQESHFWKETEFVNTYYILIGEKNFLEIIQIIRFPKMLPHHVDLLNNYLEEFLKNIIPEERTEKYEIELTYIICVDEESSTYRKLVDVQIQQIKKRLVLPIGICFKNGRVVMASTWKWSAGTDTGYMRAFFLDFLHNEEMRSASK